MKKIKGKWKLLAYAMSGLGVNMLNLIIGSYLCDALMVGGFDANIENWTYSGKTLIVAAVWSGMIAFAKILDGVIDIPFASFTDNLKSKWGKRRPAILLGFIPMIIAYVCFLNPLVNKEASILNTIWFGFMLCAFYAFYTLTMVTYYATFSEIVDNDKDRLALSNYKTVFDVVYFVLGYALIPAFIGFMNIRIIGYMFLPLSLTMLIPLFMIKEKSTLPKDNMEEKVEDIKEYGDEKEETVGIWKSIKYAFQNKSFITWLVVYFALQFGLQLFLTGQNVLYSGTMNLEGIKITIIMACAFAPVPLTLMIYNKIVRKKGINAGYRFSLIMYLLAMIIMCFCQEKIIPNVTLRVIIASIGAVISSFGTGCFFSVNYTIPSTIAYIEKKRTGISHPAMYFAVQGLASGVAVALSTGLVWVNLRDAGKGKYVWIMPLIVIFSCLVSLGLTVLLPKEINDIGKISQEQTVKE